MTYTATFTKEGFVAQTKTSEIAAHHTIEYVAEVPATCTETGTKEHWKCDVCEALFSDSAGNVPTTESELIISAKGHSYGEPEYNWAGVTACTASKTCSVCGDTVVDEAAITSAVTVEPTCTTVGERTYTATFTKEGFVVKTQTSEIAALGHTIEYAAEVPATCTETGTKEHWKCDVCEALFSDSAGNVPTTESELIISAKGHSYGEPEYNWAGVTACTASKTCSTCGDTVVDEAVITFVVTVESTCTTVGEMTYTATFSKEGFVTQTQTSEIAAFGHTIEYAAEVPATTSEYGVKAHWRCSVCGKNFSDESGTTEVSDEELRIPKIEEGGSNTIAIAAVGVIAAVGALGAAVFFLRRR